MASLCVSTWMNQKSKIFVLMSCSLWLTETESGIINVQIPVVPPCWIKNQNKVTDAAAPIYSYSRNTCQAAFPSLPYTHAHACVCAPGIRCLCKYLQDVPRLPEVIINVPRISLITRHSPYAHRLFHGSSTQHFYE